LAGGKSAVKGNKKGISILGRKKGEKISGLGEKKRTTTLEEEVERVYLKSP